MIRLVKVIFPVIAVCLGLTACGKKGELLPPDAPEKQSLTTQLPS